MSDSSVTPQVCSHCNLPLGVGQVKVAEHANDSSAVSDWTFCSWACARELVIRSVRLGRDER